VRIQPEHGGPPGAQARDGADAGEAVARQHKRHFTCGQRGGNAPGEPANDREAARDLRHEVLVDQDLLNGEIEARRSKCLSETMALDQRLWARTRADTQARRVIRNR
jgi:hypothetical protein